MVSRSLRRPCLAAVLSTALVLAAGAPALAASGWQPTGEMSVAHRAHGAALLPDGDVLAISGFNNVLGDVPAAERYDVATGTWSLAVAPLMPRQRATAERLNDGRILLAGGSASASPTTHAELFDPGANSWTATGLLSVPRDGHAAALLPNGRVLVAGGAPGSGVAFATGEVYNPVNGTWTPTASTMSAGREYLQAALLPGGRVLAAGGQTRAPSLAFHASADVYDPATNSWSPTAPMRAPRAMGAAAVLHDGRVLVAGGVNSTGYERAIELYDPATGTWSDAGELPTGGSSTHAIVLDDGRVLLQNDGSRATWLFDPASASLTAAHAASTARSLASLTVLRDGRVLMAGGSNLRSAELFTPPTERAASGGSFGTAAPGQAVERDVTISNAGGNRLWIDGTALTGAADFSIVSDACSGAELAPAGTCTVRVRFTPSAVGDRSAKLTVDDNAETSPAVTLTGGGTAPVEQPPGPPVDHGPPVDPRPPVEHRTPTVPRPSTRPVRPRAERAIERFTLARNCVRPGRTGVVRVDLRLRLAQLRPVELRIARALGTKGMRRCPVAPRGFRGKLRGVKTERVRPTAVASAVNGRRVLRARLRPGLYRLTVRLRSPDGRRSAPAHRWLRVLTPR
jgi:hypothetical protein